MSGDRRLLTGWMNNWTYAQQVPTAPRRSAQSVPRELSLRTLDGRVRLVQQPVAEFKRLRSGLLYSVSALDMAAGLEPIPLSGNTGPMEFELRLEPGKASRAGIRLRSGAQGQQTDVGYDSALGQLYLDRHRAGEHSFHPEFPIGRSRRYRCEMDSSACASWSIAHR